MDQPDRVGSLPDRIMDIARTRLSSSRRGIDFSAEDALVEVGFSSLDMANLMIAIEAEFDVMIPSAQLTPENFKSVHSIAKMMTAILPSDQMAK